MLGDDVENQEQPPVAISKAANHAAAETLAASMPRILIAEGLAEDLAIDWVARIDESEAAGRPALPLYPFSDAIIQGLFEARRGRRMVRGLEGIESALEAEEAGLAKAPATRPQPGRSRISRLLVVSGDGALRFYRAVEQLQKRFASRVAVMMVDCEEDRLGEAVYGSGQRARALMLDHKVAVVEFLLILDEIRRNDPSRDIAV
jgi:hypothetical protein